MKLKPLDYKILAGLIENSKTSDRTLARKLGVSQPTITRRRASLERQGILEYTAVPHFGKLDLGVMCFMLLHGILKGAHRNVPHRVMPQKQPNL